MANCMCESDHRLFELGKKGKHAESRSAVILDSLSERSDFVADLRYGSAAGRRVSDLKTYQIALISAAIALVFFLII